MHYAQATMTRSWGGRMVDWRRRGSDVLSYARHPSPKMRSSSLDRPLTLPLNPRPGPHNPSARASSQQQASPNSIIPPIAPGRRDQVDVYLTNSIILFARLLLHVCLNAAISFVQRPCDERGHHSLRHDPALAAPYSHGSLIARRKLAHAVPLRLTIAQIAPIWPVIARSPRALRRPEARIRERRGVLVLMIALIAPPSRTHSRVGGFV
ncbi:hypothetical protein BDY17DRAFT_63731 [Neohortaea acidophila]|uniref:Uncharacterized protein n=1 Tax=Neohortaea acidophila TaxID=245834 RepID=A0A6A6PFP1_9PEZI|nr:uncharacterized protein BDY17DRAFT_63731 [Neohortaea acidophila]KAF2478541.1 hypothetical protein BDY17DRAFT_63731 [Neohortaea acidophila]